MSSFSSARASSSSINDAAGEHGLGASEFSKRNSLYEPSERKYATLSKCSDFKPRERATLCWPKLKRRSNSVQLHRCQSDAAAMKSQAAINRNGTIARNHFRGISREIIERQTQRIILSMTVSIRIRRCSDVVIVRGTNTKRTSFPLAFGVNEN